MEIKLLLGKKMNNDYSMILGYSYELNGNEVQIMGVFFEETLIKEANKLYKEALDSKEPTDEQLEIIEDYENSTPLDFAVEHYGLINAQEDVYFKTVNQIVKYHTSVVINSSKSLFKRIENHDILYYNNNNKTISKNFR